MNHNIDQFQTEPQENCEALGSTGIHSTLMNMRALRTLTAESLLPGNDFKALVCVFLAGGNDSYNMLVPLNEDEYSNYLTTRVTPNRGGVALLPNEIIPLNVLNIDSEDTSTRTFGVHQSMPEIQDLFNEGNIAFIANTGTLVTPISDKYDYNSKKSTPLVPRSLFSHNDQMMQWQTLPPLGMRSNTGWAGRMADILQLDANGMAQVAMNISLGGNNFWQTGDFTNGYSISPENGISLIGKGEGLGSINGLRYSLVGSSDKDENSLAGQLYRNLFEKSYMREFQKSLELDTLFSNAFNSFELPQSVIFENFSLAKQLEAVAKTIGIRAALGMRRQVYFVLSGGWDDHNNLLNAHSQRLNLVSRAMKSFWEALKLMTVENNVLTFTASDFARTLRSNGRGTDHAWGGNYMVMGGSNKNGGPLKGQRIWGQYPGKDDFKAGDDSSKLDVGSNGRLLPTTAVDQYMAEMAAWFGVPESRLIDVFPNLRNFNSPTINFLDR